MIIILSQKDLAQIILQKKFHRLHAAVFKFLVNPLHLPTFAQYHQELWIVFCKYCSHRIESHYHSINHQLQKSEAFQSVHHVTLILCYTVLYNFLGFHCHFGRHRAEVHWTSCGFRFATVGAKRTSTGCPVPLYFPLSGFVNAVGTI